jgi:4-diphosphocytidyl-2-C-methyl-D-erythritol kinase
MPDPITLKSNAKVNLALRITGRRENGYHTISTLFQEIDLHDKLIFEKSGKFDFSSSDPDLPLDDRNLCVLAYKKLSELADDSNRQAYQIHLEKNIPVGAGLGGGSSNAATVFRFLNRHWKLNFSEEKLLQLARSLGADVPFFIKGGTQIGEGIGDVLKPVRLVPNFKILCIIPDFNISTEWAYKKFSLTNRKDKFNFDRLILDGFPNWELFENHFEEIVTQSYPEISDMKQKLLKGGAEYAGLSGSGSTVIGVFKRDKDLKQMCKSIDYVTAITNPVIN